MTPRHDKEPTSEPTGLGPADARHPCARRRGISLRGLAADERGQALPEFALVLPLLLLVLFGIVEFGLALNSESDQTHLANEVARYAIVNENPGGAEALQDWAKKQGDNNFLTSTGKICVSFPEGEEAGKPVKVEATSTIKWLPILNLKATSTTLKGTAYMRLEAAPVNYKAGCSK
jgi:Flp pilus assembly protein TadG